MKTKKRKPLKQKELSIEEIEDKKSKFEEIIKEEIEQKEFKTTGQKILFNIKDIVLEARKNKLSYQRISEKIEEVYGYKISPQTIGTFIREREKEK